MKFHLISPKTAQDTNRIQKCSSELERLQVIFNSGKPHAGHCIDLNTLKDFYAPEIGRYRVYPEGRKGGYRFKTAKGAFTAACEMYNFLIQKIKELEEQQ